jgi:exopolysaccharide production protein ExoZ
VIYNIQTLRVFFAMLVVTGHLQTLYIAMGLVNPDRRYDGLANDGFLIVSSFVLVYSGLRKAGGAGEFLGRRLARLVPFYWLVTLVVAGLCIVAPALFQSTQVTAETLAKSLFFIPYLKHDSVIAPIVFVGWTMNYFIFFLLVHTAFLLALGSRAWIATAATLAGLAAIGAAFQPTDVIAKFFTGPRQIDFAIGAALAGLWHTRPLRLERQHANDIRAIAFALIAAAFVVRFGQQIWFREAFDSRYVGPLASLSLVLGAMLLEANGDRHRSKLRDMLAEASFSLYLSHFFVTQMVQKTVERFDIHNVPVLIGLALFAYVGAAVLAVLVFRLIEKPLDAQIRGAWRWASEHLQPARAVARSD